MQHGAFDDIEQHIRDSVLDDIAQQLLQDWIDSNSDESQYFLDMQVAHRSYDPVFRKAFNEFYKLKPEDDDYFEVE